MTEQGDQTTSTLAAKRTAPPAIRTAYRVVLGLYLLLGVVQIFLAGLGVFSLFSSGPGFDPHRTVGFVMSGVALVIVVMAVVARAGGRAIGLAVLLLVLVAVGQSLFAGLGDEAAFWGGVHALSGLATLGIAGYLQAQARGETPAGRR
jgi:Family of unknown function (DUF6220)